MAIHDKPFDFSEAIKRTIFKGRPNFFNAKDFNKELSIIHEFVEEFNSIFAVHSDVAITVTNFSENATGSTVTRNMGISWGAGNVLYKGVKLPIVAGNHSGYSRQYTYATSQPSPANPRPPEYIVLTADLVRVTYADNPTLCGIQADELIQSAPTVDVDQYQNANILITGNLASVPNIICVLGTVFPRYNGDGTFKAWNYLNNALSNNPEAVYSGKGKVAAQTLKGNNSLYERLSLQFINKYSNLRNELQLSARFNLADLTDPANARHNIGLSNVLNHRQLVQSENLRDLTNPALARQNLGLKTAATKRVGFGANDVAPGNIFANDMVMIFVGSPASIPTGWELCNGSNGTRDLRGKFVVGLDTSDPDYNAVAKAGGAAKVPLTIDNLPSHSHTGQTDMAGEHSHSYQLYERGSRGEAKSDAYWRVNGDPSTWETAEGGEHSHTVTMNNTGGDQPHENRPPYFVVAFIQYVGGTYNDGYTTLSEPAALVTNNYSAPDSNTDGGLSVLATYEANNPDPSVGNNITVANP
jgi:microcystin-dependent protein